jgi:transcriptional regulator with XRE-family HTH domain
MPVFSDDDPAGRPESSLARAKAARREFREQTAAHEANKPFVIGERLRERREAIGLSVEGLSERMGVPDTWVEDVESGRTTSAVTITQWVDLVWATREPWPDERRLRNTGRYGWAAGDLLYAAEDIVQHHLDVVEQQNSPEQET